MFKLSHVTRAFDIWQSLEKQILLVINISSLLTYSCAPFLSSVLSAGVFLFFSSLSGLHEPVVLFTKGTHLHTQLSSLSAYFVTIASLLNTSTVTFILLSLMSLSDSETLKLQIVWLTREAYRTKLHRFSPSLYQNVCFHYFCGIKHYIFNCTLQHHVIVQIGMFTCT